MKEELLNTVCDVEQKLKMVTDERTKLERKCTEISSLKEVIQKLETDKSELNEKLSWMSVNQESQNLFKKKMEDMLIQKKHLAYEKGALQSEVKRLQEDIEELSNVQVMLLLVFYIIDHFEIGGGNVFIVRVIYNRRINRENSFNSFL